MRGQGSKNENTPVVRGGQKWSKKEGKGDDLEILYSAEGWAHRAIVARSHLGPKMIEPRVLFSQYQMTEEGEGDIIDTSTPPQKEIKHKSLVYAKSPPKEESSLPEEEYRVKRRERFEKSQKEKNEPMTSPQKHYLKRLCQDAGEEFNESLTKAEAHKEIDRLLKKD